MENNGSVASPAVTGWQTESLRTTSFPSSTAQFDGADWWLEVTGEQPENQVVRLREGTRQDEGHVDGVRLVLAAQPTRVDWLAIPEERQDVLAVASLDDALAFFLPVMSRWLEVSPPLRRLALGATLTMPVQDRRSGYMLLAQYLPGVTVEPERSSDLLYQINRPRFTRTGIPRLVINRLSKWAVVLQGTARIDLSVPVATLSYLPTSQAYACRLELDINTAPDFPGDLPHDQLGALLEEFADLSREIAAKGDIP